MSLLSESAAALEPKAKPVNKSARSKKFRASLPWRRTRYKVLAENAERNGGIARCELCGVAGQTGAPLHVDHVEAISRNWERRLDATNLQVLCADCNVGKLAGPARDFRRAG